MNLKISSISMAFVILFSPLFTFSQSPNLGSLTNMAMFTNVGAFSNSGPSSVLGDIGTNSGAISGFPPGIVNGQTFIEDPTTLMASADVTLLYNSLAAIPCGTPLGSVLGGNQILTPDVYCLGAASTLNGNLFLDAEGDPNAIFIFNIDGAFSVSALSNLILINSASARNIYWRINGAFELGAYSVFRGTLVVNGAIELLNNASLLGRGLSKVGAITLNSSNTIRYLSTLHINTFIEGYYLSNELMDSVLTNSNLPNVLSSMSDSIKIELHNTSFPYNLVTSSTTILNTNGTATSDFPVLGTYYIVVKHRNGLQTWSAMPIELTSLPAFYNFTDSSSKTYGNHLKQVDFNHWAIYSGDINQDENIDLLDLAELELGIANFDSGYINTDLNGDGNTDLLDIPLLENNIGNFIFSMHP